MQPESSLPHSQMPATCPYPEPAPSSPYAHIPLPVDPSYSYPPIYSWVSQVVSFPQITTSKSCIRLSSPHVCYMTRPSHSSRFYYLRNIWWAVQIIKLLIMQFSPHPSYLVPPRPKYSPQHPILKHPQRTFLSQCERPSFTPIQTTGKMIFLYILNVWLANLTTKNSAPNDSKHSLTSVCS